MPEQPDDDFSQYEVKPGAQGEDDFSQYEVKPEAKAAPVGEIRPAETGVKHWLGNLESDIRQGTTTTLPGRVLHAMGARGIETGTTPAVAENVAGPLIGPVTAAQGILDIPQHPWEGTKTAAKGILEAAGPALAFQSPVVAEEGAGILGKAPVIGKIFASKGNAAKNFQEAMRVAKNAPVDITPELSESAIEIKNLADRGGSMPKVVRDFLKRVTAPEGKPLTYEEARGFASNASRLSADEMKRLTPQARRLVGQFHVNLNNSIQAAADRAGVGDIYGQAMKEFAAASQRNKTVSAIGKYGLTRAIPTAGAIYEINRLTKQH